MADKNIGIRPWGRWTVLAQGPGYKVKKIEVLPKRRLSLQKHKHRSEHWTVVSGKAEALIGARTIRLKKDRSVYVPSGAAHRLSNPGRVPLRLIEVQVGSYLGEDDIVRLEDDYGRVKSKVATKR